MSENNVPKCAACGRQVKGLEFDPGHPVEVHAHCRACKIWNNVFLLIPIFCIILACLLWLFSGIFIITNMKAFVSQFGLLLDIFGVTLLIGNLEKIMVAIGIWGSHNIISSEMPKHIRKTRWGLILVVRGFILQFGACFIK